MTLLKAAQEVLEAVPGTMAVGELLGMALVWCDTAGGM